MSKKIPFLQLFSMVNQWPELAQATGRWMIVSATFDRGSRSAKVSVEGASGAGPNLIFQVEEAIGKVYGLVSVKLDCLSNTSEDATKKKPAAEEKKPESERPEPTIQADMPQLKPTAEMEAFARTEAIRAEALKNMKKVSPSAAKGEGKAAAKPIFGNTIKKMPIPIRDLELDMGMVVVEGDVFAVDNKELKKRGAWVVAFDVTDYTGSIRINKFFPGEEGKPIVDGVKKGMHLTIQGRLNMDRFYGDMVLEPIAIMVSKKPMKMDEAPEKRVELHPEKTGLHRGL